MKTLLLTSYGSHLGGGLYSTMTSYSQAMQRVGIEPVVACFADEFWQEDKQSFGSVSTALYQRSGLPVLKQLGYSKDIHEVVENEHTDIIHQQGIWMYYSYATLVEKKKNPKCKVIIEPHGMLDPWAVKNSAWKKKIVGRLFEYRNLRSADCIHALCQSEYESIRKFGLKNPVAIIPNGIDLPQTITYEERNGERKILLFIGRIHPKKGIREMIEGLAILKERHSKVLDSWEVHIAGWDQLGHTNELKRIVEAKKLTDKVKFLGPLFGEAKEKALCHANAFILPSFSEGLPMSVLEAWAYELPVIMTDYCNIPEGFENRCAMKTEPTPEDIYEKLTTLFNMNTIELIEMGQRGKALVAKRFTWEVVARQTIELYRYLLGDSNKPDYVYED